MILATDITTVIQAMQKRHPNYPWQNINETFPAYLADYGWMDYGPLEWDGDNRFKVRFTFPGAEDQVFEADVNFDSWDHCYSWIVYEVEEYIEPVKKYRRKK